MPRHSAGTHTRHRPDSTREVDMSRLTTRRRKVLVEAEVPQSLGSARGGDGASAGSALGASVGQYAQSARTWAAPRVGAAKSKVDSDVTPRVLAARDKVAGDLLPRLLAGAGAVLAANRNPFTQETAVRLSSALAALRGEAVVPVKRRRGNRKLLLLLVPLAAAGVGWQVWSRRKAKQSWELPTYAGRPAGTATTTTPVTTTPVTTTPVTTTPVTTTAVTTTPVTTTSTTGAQTGGTVTNPLGDDTPDMDATLPADSVDDGTAASRSPMSARSEEGPGISDTDDAATRAQAGEAGRAAFENAADPENRRS